MLVFGKVIFFWKALYFTLFFFFIFWLFECLFFSSRCLTSELVSVRVCMILILDFWDRESFIKWLELNSSLVFVWVDWFLSFGFLFVSLLFNFSIFLILIWMVFCCFRWNLCWRCMDFCVYWEGESCRVCSRCFEREKKKFNFEYILWFY